ncbi:hypothetical protein H696_02525 [Fonticula alba]|uniref:Uncharacterized protein n=1 Tax=Fonticula alba TaxID=691883 RepID=A0A058ZDP5_FONAL|nr:hypothetical protein H696_02525 [Fonticula alba]KCV71587.1 hypothetical protein H696_02525 [Fonticula alba]|eukprot:XP_009494710.1 hypothetical protein H696_02525 [Fonticula alba]
MPDQGLSYSTGDEYAESMPTRVGLKDGRVLLEFGPKIVLSQRAKDRWMAMAYTYGKAEELFDLRQPFRPGSEKAPSLSGTISVEDRWVYVAFGGQIAVAQCLDEGIMYPVEVVQDIAAGETLVERGTGWSVVMARGGAVRGVLFAGRVILKEVRTGLMDVAGPASHFKLLTMWRLWSDPLRMVGTGVEAGRGILPARAFPSSISPGGSLPSALWDGGLRRRSGA